MQFDSFTFIAFFALVLLGYNGLRGWNARKNLLLAASYLFYAAWNPPFVLLLIGSTTLDWWIARRIDRAERMATRKAWVAATVGINLAVLGYFKYSGFVLAQFSALLGTIGIVYQAPAFDIVLPIGISFYTFHSLSYCIDIYRRKFPPTPSWRDYALYVGFFPQLVAGPIVRWTQMRVQIEQPRATTAAGLGLGLTLLVLGLFEKVVLADGVFAPVADQLFAHAAVASTQLAWVGTLAFSGQIFCDFAGYSTCALGSALALGFVLPINFKNPYAAIGFSDFWRRWHISLSSWLRDYLYIPLGGNRDSRLHTFRNIMLTMLIGGLWHGASWTFVAWGGLHGLYLCLERALRRDRDEPRNAAARAGLGLLTLLGVVYAWIWFRATSFADGWAISSQLFALGSFDLAALLGNFAQSLALSCFLALLAVHWLFRNRDPKTWLAGLPAPWLALLLSILLILIVLSPGDSRAFIYFQF